jgi:tubulin polyglutamylase TTLL5
MIRLLERVQEITDTYKQQAASTGMLTSNHSMTSLLNNQNNSLARLYARQRPNIFFRPIHMHQLL